jgi:hypothetical protein
VRRGQCVPMSEVNGSELRAEVEIKFACCLGESGGGILMHFVYDRIITWNQLG